MITLLDILLTRVQQNYLFEFIMISCYIIAKQGIVTVWCYGNMNGEIWSQLDHCRRRQWDDKWQGYGWNCNNRISSVSSRSRKSLVLKKLVLDHFFWSCMCSCHVLSVVELFLIDLMQRTYWHTVWTSFCLLLFSRRISSGGSSPASFRQQALFPVKLVHHWKEVSHIVCFFFSKSVDDF